MFEAHVLHLLRQYLGEYVRGLSAEALKISVWQGDVILKDLQLKAEALNSLNLPITVKAGFLGSITLKVPWNRLGKESVVVLLDRIFILAEPIQDERSCKENDKEKLLEAKRHRLEEAELAMLEAKERKTIKTESSAETSSWLGSLIATIIGNLKISITNVHIRYEDSTSNPGKPFCAGVTLSRLAAVTIDENAKETFVPSGALDKLHKSLHLERFSIYHDSNTLPWNVGKNWEDMTPKEWSEVFEVGISQEAPLSSNQVNERQYLLHPVDGILSYHRRGKREKRDPTMAFQNISLLLNEVSLTISEAQYCDGLKLLEGVSRYRTRIEFSHFRPRVSVLKDPRTWWIYACQAGLQQQKRSWNRLSWETVDRLCCLRRKYVQLYADTLLQKLKTVNKEIREIEEEMDTEVLLLWRLLAHAKLESMKIKEATLEREKLGKSRWWAFGWKTASADVSGSAIEPTTEKQGTEPGQLTNEEWSKINELLSYRPGEESSLLVCNKEAPDMLQISIDATIRESAVCILDKKMLQILCGNFTTLNVGLKLYPKTLECHVKLLSYGLSAPEGSLIKSVRREGKDQALTAYYVHHPLRENLDWKLSATVSPCYVTVWLSSFERFMAFFKNSHAVSPDVALETATALQNKLEQVRRRAQEQLKIALEEQSRFSVDLDLDAPKVRLPAVKLTNEGLDTQLLLDLGHFTLHTANEEPGKEQTDEYSLRTGLYSRCYISGSDIAAYLVDGLLDWSEMHDIVPIEAVCGSPRKNASGHGESGVLFPILDRCGMFLLFEKIRIPHPTYPSTHVAIQVPHLGLHFSPARYERFMQLIATFEGSNSSQGKADPSDSTVMRSSWYPADQEGSMRVLFWKGLGNAVAEWQPCWVVLSGSYLYILESTNAQTYQRCCSMNGKHVLEVPSSNIGGSEFVLAVCNRGMELQKALESSNTVIIQFKDEKCKAMWLRSLTLAVYKASAPMALSLPEELLVGAEDIPVRHADFLGQPIFFVTGSLHELQLSVYAVTELDVLGSQNESLILNMQAGGGKVNVLQRHYDLTVGMKLHYLKVEDKLQGYIAPSCQYIARSALSKIISRTDDGFPNEMAKPKVKNKDDEDCFKDALAEFGGSPDMSSSSESHSSYVFNSLAGAPRKVASDLEHNFSAWGLDPFNLSAEEHLMDEIFEEFEGAIKNFVSMYFIMRQFESPDYDGIDIQMSICMATLEFFCNRRTVIALISFGTEISEIVEKQQYSGSPTNHETDVVSPESLDSSADRVIVKGLLGQGKSRTVFQLKMKMDSVRIFLNKEDGSQLAMLDQDRFQMDLNVYPASFTISGTLGNLRVCDMALGQDHYWGWICDIRDRGSDSLVKLEFQSYSVDDEDYQGYDYSLDGRLSSVRIVFLYKFIQEITTYFAALATPQAQQVTRVVDKVGGIEKLVRESDIDGAPALKLNIFLETPIIIMPRCSTSKEFMQLDLGYLQISNRFEWHGGTKDDASAVLLDVLSAEISGINLVVGVNGIEGKAMVQEVRGLCISVSRPLRDLFRTVPELQVDVQVQRLRGIMSDKEYLVITGCAVTNIAEVPNLLPDFRDGVLEKFTLKEGTSDRLKIPELRTLASAKGSRSRQADRPWTVARVTIDVQNAELELYNGIERDSALARVELQGFWLNYRSTSSEELDVLVTLPRLCVLDLRSDTKPEMRLMLGSMVDMEDYGALGGQGQGDGNNEFLHKGPFPPMLVMDVRMKKESQAFVIRIQRPRLLVVIDFLLSVGEFFVPSLAAITGKDEAMNAHKDPIIVKDHIRLTSPVYRQDKTVVTLSANQQLIVDAPDIIEFTYDGGGNILFLDTPDDQAPQRPRTHPVIVVGPGKKLSFKNVRIKNGIRLRDCLQLQSGSSYSILAEDGVVLDGVTGDTNAFEPEPTLEGINPSINTSKNISTGENNGDPVMSFIIDVQAIAPELTFYDGEKWSYASMQRREKLLRAKMDLNLMYAYKDGDTWIRGHVKRFSVDSGSGLSVVDPMVISTEYACVKEKTSLMVKTSDISACLSFSLMRLLLRLHNDALSTFQFGGGYVLSRCSHFDRIWLNDTGHDSRQRIAIWRPRAPSGYAILSDCVTSGEAPPSQAVMAVCNAYRRVTKPLRFELVWVLNDSNTPENDGTKDTANSCSIWRPIAPPGYVALGCVAKMGSVSPSLSVVNCVRIDLVTSASINDCIFYVPPGLRSEAGFSIWRIDNAAGSFFAHQCTEPPLHPSIYDLRERLYEAASTDRNGEDVLNCGSQPISGSLSHLEQRPSMSTFESAGVNPKSGRYIATTAQFECMWWDKGSDPRRVIAIWRPIPRPGYAILGDYITEGLEPPSVGVVLQDDNSGRVANPIRFVQRMHSSGKGTEDLFVWYPVAPAGYVTLGCVVSKSEETVSLNTVRCVRADLVTEVNISRKPVWSSSTSKSGYSCSLWRVENLASTFLARPDLRRPPSRLGYGLVETVENRLYENLSAEMRIRRLSVTIFDDLRGLVTPLVDVTMTSINLAANGRTEAFNAVCVASLAASTFNTQLEAWEPLIEPFEGIFKFESHDSQCGPTFKVGKRMRITTANMVNLNVTAANVDALVGAALSWRKQSESEQKAVFEMDLKNDGISEVAASHIGSALEEDDSEKVLIENKLGHDLYVRTFEDGFLDSRLLKSDKSMDVHMPPPNFPEKIVTSSGLQRNRQHVAIHVVEARELPVNDDGNGQDYFYSLRLVPEKQVTDGNKISIQSARSRCVRPSNLMQRENAVVATARWDEVFIFYLEQGYSNVDIRVSNQAAEAGRGELIGMLSLPLIEEGSQELTSSSHWKHVRKSISQQNQSGWPLVQGKIYYLESPKQQGGDIPAEHTYGSLVVNVYFFTEKANWHAEGETEKNDCTLNDTGVLMAWNPSGPWTSIRSYLALGIAPIMINDHVALEVTMNQGHKCAILRSLVTVFNDTDIVLDVCVCPVSLLNSPDESRLLPTTEAVSEMQEVFENQRYQPLAGWGSKWPGHFLPADPRRWSNRDYQRSSQSRGDLEDALPPGWIWNTDWIIDKAGYVDDDGWAYGPDFHSLRWPPNSLRSCKKLTFDFVRRRRWVRSRQRVPENSQGHCREAISILQPGGCIPLPFTYTSAQTDYCVQVRPHSDSTAALYLWGRSVSATGQSSKGFNKNEDGQSSNRGLTRLNKYGIPVSLFMLSQLEKTEELLICPPAHPSTLKTYWWFSMEADATILYTEMNSPVYDWRLSVSAPLKLENLLPCAAEYTIWERLKEGKPVQRCRGVVPAGGIIHIFSVDIRRPVYLTWLVQGGWKLEKEIVLISDQIEELPAAFFLINQLSGRRLQISLEHDFGSTNTASRTVRIFVPYWLCNKAALPLSYCLVEVEPSTGSDTETPWLLRAVKAAKQASRRPSHSPQSKASRLRRVVQQLGAIENTGATPTMLSPQLQYNRTGFMPFSPRADDGLLSPRLGISASLHHNSYQDGISFRDLEDNERVDMKAMDTNGAYYKLSVFLSMSSERTKVVNFQPHTLFVNRLGQMLYVQQCDVDCAELISPNDPPKAFLWRSGLVPELLKVCIDGYKWSTPFSVDTEGISHILMRSDHNEKNMIIRADIRNGTTESRLLVIFRHMSLVSPYRIENRSMALPIQFRQAGGSYDSWQLLQPGSAVAFAWEDLQREHQLEIIVDGADPVKSQKYNIDVSADYQPMATQGVAAAALHIRTFKEGFLQVVKISDWMPSNKDLSIVPFGTPIKPTVQEQVMEEDFSHSKAENQFYFSVELAEFGLSVVDHSPEELLYLSMQNFTLGYASGLGSGISRFKLRVDRLQLDNQLPLTPMPVLFYPQLSGNTSDFVFKCAVTSQDNGSSNRYVYPYIGVQGPSTSNTAFMINIHEPIIWRLHQMFRHLNLSRLATSQTTDVAVDPIIYIGLLNTSEIRFKVSLAMSPTQRPRGALGFWASLMTALGNTDDLQVRIAPRIHEDICMRQSSLMAGFISSVRKDLLSHPLQLLSGMDILGNASSALGHMSKGVAALSMDKKFIRSRQKQASVEGFGDGFREGAEAFGKGLFRGVTGILTKPLEGARSSGMEGFVQGVGKGIIGVAAQPVSGVLDLLSKTTEGANAMKTKIAAVITSEAVLLRRRLPRVIGGDNILRPYDEYKAQGQILLQLAEHSSIFGPMDIFKMRGKFAMSDAYEDHYDLPKGRTLIVTHRRVILLQHPTNIIVQKKPDLLKDPCTVLWDVVWKDLLTIELMPGKHEPQNAMPSRLALHLRTGSQDALIFDSKELVRIIKCHPNTDQADRIHDAILQAMTAYGPDRTLSGTRIKQQERVRKPYSGPVVDSASIDVFDGPATPVDIPPMTAFNALLETSGSSM